MGSTDNYEEVLDLLFEGDLQRIEEYPINMKKPVKFKMLKNKNHSITREFLIDREFFIKRREKSMEMLLDNFYKFIEE